MLIKTTSSIVYSLTLAMLAVTLPVNGLQAQKSPGKPPPSTQAGLPPYSLDGLLRLIRDSKGQNPVIALKAAINSIRSRGLDFKPSQDVLDNIRKESGSQELITAIKDQKIITPKTLRVAVFPPEPPRRKEGRLTVRCKPVDCIVTVDWTQIGTTTKGELKDHALPAGKMVRVSVASENYIPDNEGIMAKIVENSSVPVEFILTLNQGALWSQGIAHFERMIAALGGEPALKESEFFRSHGTLDVFNQANKKTTYPFSTVVRLPGMAKFEISKANKFTTVTADSGFAWKPRRIDGEFDDLEDGLRYLTDNHITQLIERLRGPRARVEPEKLDFKAGEEVVLRVEREGYKYKVVLNLEGRPKEITLESGGLNSGVKILLSKYQKQGEAYIPMTTEVILPGTGIRGVIVKYESMEINPSGVNKADLSKKGFMSWRR